MQIVLIIAGGIVGLWVGEMSREMLGMVAGGVIGYLYAQRHAMQRQIRDLGDQVQGLVVNPPEPSQTPDQADATAAVAEPQPEPEVAATDGPASEPEPELEPTPEPVSQGLTASDDETESDAGRALAARTVSHDTPEPANRLAPPLAADGKAAAGAPQPPALPPLLGRAFAAARSWLTTGNVPVKLGVVVSFFGVAFLLKYAVDQQVLAVPIELRYLAIAAAAAVMLGFGWRLRSRLRVYALSLQGGGIGILYLTIFAAFRLHPLIPAPFAFFLLIALTASAGILAVIQNARGLAVLGIVGGFAAPVLISTGSANHVGLFTYYLLLNAAVLGIAWFRAWRFLNVLGFVFTFGVGTAWGVKYYRPELLWSTEPFLIAFFVFYQAIAILFAFRQPPNLRGLVDGTLVFGTPVIAFALQSQLVAHTRYGLAISAMTIAVLYTLIAIWLGRIYVRGRLHDRGPAMDNGHGMRLLTESFVALAVAFATIAIPLALDDRWTAVSWALEGAALVWVGVRQSGVLARLTGTALLFASGVAYINYGWSGGEGLLVFNGDFIGGMLIAVASLFSARYLAADPAPMRAQWLLSVPLLLWGLGWWGSIGTLELADRGPEGNRLHLITTFVALSAAGLAQIASHYQWVAARRATLSYLPLLPLIALLFLIDGKHFFAGFGLLAWAVATVSHFAVLRIYDQGDSRVEGLWHFAGALLLVALVATEVAWQMQDARFSAVWSASCALVIPLLGALVIMSGHRLLSWPLQRYWTAYLGAAGVLIAAQLMAIGSAGLDDGGNPAPLPYVPLLNPFDLLTLAGLVMAAGFLTVTRSATGWLADGRDRVAFVLWGIAAFFLTTLAVVRGVHHFADVPWSQFALSTSVHVQSALSIFWAILGFAGMIWGARHHQRSIWLTGTGLMALVVVKLFVIDLGNSGTVARIVSFLGVGVLLLVVGYLAPAPPKITVDKEGLADE